MALQLNGWQRLWVWLTVIWSFAVLTLGYSNYPETSICNFPRGVSIEEVKRILGEHLVQSGTLADHFVQRSAWGLADRRVSPEERTLGLYLPDNAPYVPFCDYVKPHLEQSGGAATMRSSAKWANAEYITGLLALWLVPATVVYAMGLALVRVVQRVSEGR
jgi:hypothetical protein